MNAAVPITTMPLHGTDPTRTDTVRQRGHGDVGARAGAGGIRLPAEARFFADAVPLAG